MAGLTVLGPQVLRMSAREPLAQGRAAPEPVRERRPGR
ncbi:MAG: hypothetical protein JWN62_3139, partial [Acidimicrobiales bacterium]|nr:hypothetical protein [Acidimicrobiales bacterium]